MAENKITKEEYYNMEFNVGELKFEKESKLKRAARAIGKFYTNNSFYINGVIFATVLRVHLHKALK